MILEVKNKKWCNQSIKVGEKEYQIDKLGKFEEKDEDVAKAIAEKYDFIYQEGKLPKVKEVKASDPADQETINDLTVKLAQANSIVEAKKNKIKELEEEVSVWRTKCEELIKGTASEDLVKEIKLDADKKEEEEFFKMELGEMDLEALKGILKDLGGDLRGVSTKEKAIEKILDIKAKE
jgi:hypothetical protein